MPLPMIKPQQQRVASLVFAQSPQSDERANPQQAQAPGGQDTNPEPAHPPPITASEHKPEGGGDNKEHECRYNGPRWFAGFYCFFAEHEKFWVSFGTIILAAVTPILGAATVFLYRATRDLTVFLNQRLDPKHLAALSAGTHALRVIGKIDYLDAFGKARWTRFNLFYGGSYGLNTGLALNHGPDGNEAT